MNVLTLIRESIRDLNENQKPLSQIIHQTIRIASIIGDIKNLTWLRMEMTNYSNKEEMQKMKWNYCNFYSSKFQLEWKQINDQFINEIFQPYFNRRKIDLKDTSNDAKFYAFSIDQLENEIIRVQHQIENNIVPEGLHQVDLYFVNKEKNEVEIVLFQHLQVLQLIISNVRTKVYGYLIELEMEYMNGETPNTERQHLKNKNIFVIHGHNEAKWRELEKMLKDDFKLNPIILQEQPDRGGSTLIDKFEYYANDCSYAIAIFTPDDIVENNGEKYFQARPNVIFEIGWFSARLGRRNVCILFQEGENADIFSDFQGVIQKRFRNKVSEVYRDIMLELRDVGMIE